MTPNFGDFGQMRREGYIVRESLIGGVSLCGLFKKSQKELEMGNSMQKLFHLTWDESTAKILNSTLSAMSFYVDSKVTKMT